MYPLRIIATSHFPDGLNVVANKTGRELKDDVEWAIDHGVFDMLIKNGEDLKLTCLHPG